MLNLSKISQISLSQSTTVSKILWKGFMHQRISHYLDMVHSTVNRYIPKQKLEAPNILRIWEKWLMMLESACLKLVLLGDFFSSFEVSGGMAYLTMKNA